MDQQAKLEVKKTFNSTIFFVKLDRLAAWILFFVILAYAVTGYGMTKGLIDQRLAQSLHLGWLGAIGLVAFVIHTYHAISIAFKRWRIWNRIINSLLLLVYILFIGFFIFLQFFYSGSFNGELNNNYRSVNGQAAGANIDTSNLPVYTADDLAIYNGLNGQPAYAAVDGLVYDFSRLFRNGNHHGYSAGEDLSAAFHNQHPNSFLNGYSIVGIYK